MLMYFFAGFFFCNLTLCMTKLNLGFRLIKSKNYEITLFRRGCFGNGVFEIIFVIGKIQLNLKKETGFLEGDI